MKVDTQSFPGVNMVENYDRSARRQLDFALGINMAGVTSRYQGKNREADPSDRPQKEKKEYITERQVRYVRNQRPTSSDLLRNMNTSTSSASSGYLRKKNMSATPESA
jgi:hypothetical protein